MITDHNPKVTGLLLRWGQGGQDALEQLMIPLVHHELHRIARCFLVDHARARHTKARR